MGARRQKRFRERQRKKKVTDRGSAEMGFQATLPGLADEVPVFSGVAGMEVVHAPVEDDNAPAAAGPEGGAK